MTLEPCSERQISFRNENQKFVEMRRNVPKSSHFGPLKRPKNVIFKAIDLKFCTHTHQDVHSNICSGFLKILKIFENIFKKPKFWL